MADKSKSGKGIDDDAQQELDNLLQGLRVLLPGVQVLFAFLLTAAFSQGFAQTTDPQRTAFHIAIVAIAIGAILLMAPSVHHRIMFRDEDPEMLLKTATRYILVGTAFVGVAMTAGVFMVLDFIFGPPNSLITTVAVGVLLVGVWYAHPLIRRDNKKA